MLAIRYDVIQQFLLYLYPNGPWTLTAISRSKKEITSETFSSIDDALSWVRDHESFNLYYSVNQPTPSARNKKKFSKTDIESVHYLHVDVDPRAGENIESEQTRILNQLTSYKIPPSVIVFSGGGYNALWKLSKPIVLLAESDEQHIRNAIEVERRNWQFELDFATPDHCRDVSRILRLPGTINRPSDEKIKKGRIPAQSSIARLDESLVYDYEIFMATPLAPTNSSSSKTRTSENIKRIASVDELPVSDKVKAVIVQGFDPDNPNDGTKSRSEFLFYAVCEMVRANVPDEIILGVITDANFEISKSVLDKGSQVMRYATRQIDRAKDLAINPRLMEMNEKFAVIQNYGGRCVVMREDEDGLSFQAPREFFNARASSYVQTKDNKGRDVMVSDGKWWFNQPRRRQYEKVVFDPTNESHGSYNLFSGFAVQPVAGTKHHGYLEHVYQNICSGNEEHYQYLLKWMARVVQQPATQSEVAVVLIGGRGTGKSFFCSHFLEIFGRHGAVVDNMDHLIGRFNSHMGDKILVVAEEAYHAYDRRNESVLKELITGKRRAVERKGFDVFWGSNFVHLMMTSNNDKVVPAGDHERRFFVLRVGEAKMQNSAYFAKIDEEMKSGGLQNLMHELLSIDLKDFNVRDIPRTKALVEQQQMSMSYEMDWLLGKLQSGIWLEEFPNIPWEGPVAKELLYRDYLKYVTDLRQPYPFTRRVFVTWLAKQIDCESRQLPPVNGPGSARPPAFIFPSLSHCRNQFLIARNWPDFSWDTPATPPDKDDEVF